MATIIKHKRSNTPGAVPEVEDLAEGEIAINTADGKLFITKGDNEEKEVVTIISDAVSRSAQTLNDTEKAQVRANIDVPERIVLDVVAPGGAGVGGAVPLTLSDSKAYTIRLNTTGTGTKTGAVYNLWFDGSEWQLKRLTGESGSNHPELRLNSNGDGLEVFTQHEGDYTIRLHIDIWNTNNSNGIAESFFDTAVIAVGDAFINVKNFGATGNGTTLDTTAVLNAIDAAVENDIEVVFFPQGVFLLDPIAIPDNITFQGAGINKTTLKLNPSASLTAIPAHPNVVQEVQIYAPFLYTEKAGQVGQWSENVHLEKLTVDWGNHTAGNNAAAPVWFGNVRNCSACRVKVINCLPSDYSIVTTQGRGVSILMSYVEDGLIDRCKFTDAASYEELGIRYYNRDITVRKSHFAGKGPWRHNIEVAAARNLSLVDEWPKGIVIENNLFELHGNKQDVLSCHDGGDVIFRNNRVLVMDDLVDTAESGVRCLVKRFDAGEGFLLVDGNIFDFRNVPSTVKRAFEVVRIWADNVTVKGNIIRGRTDGFDSSLETVAMYPWIGTGSNSFNPRNVIVSDNCLELYQYSDSETFQIIKLTGNGNVVQGNTLYLKNPITVTTDGPQFIDIHGSLKDAPGAPSDGAGGGRSNVVIGNTSYADTPNSLLTQISMRGGGGAVEQQLVVMGNPSNCAVTMLGSTPYIGAGFDPSTENGMRYAVGNIGAGTGNQQYRYHTFTWDPTSIDAGKQTDTTVSIPGLAMGDEITATFSQDLQFCTLTAYPISAGNARVVLTNTSASTKDLPSGTVTLRIRNRL